MFRIKSVNSDACLEFSARQGEEFTVSFHAHDHNATTRVWAYTEAGEIARMFREAALAWRGMPRPKIWQSIEGEFQISLTSDKLGHFTVEIVLSHNFGSADAWALRASLGLEAGQLESVAKEAEAFFA